MQAVDSCAEVMEPSRSMGPTSLVRSRLMCSRATTGVQPLHEGRLGVRLCADLWAPLLHNGLSPFDRSLMHGTHAHVVSATHRTSSGCGRGLVEQRYPQNSFAAFVLLTILRTKLANWVCNKPPAQ